jgi:preprotein translocase subunit SecG
MNVLFLILIILICVVLSFFVLIQNPKGGGMAGTFGGFGNQVMGAKQSAEGVEKVTWWSMGALALVVLLSFVMMDKPTNTKASGNEAGKPLKATTAPIQAPTPPPANTAAPGATGSAPAGTQGQNPSGAQGAPAGQAAPAGSGEAPLPQPSENKSTD